MRCPPRSERGVRVRGADEADDPARLRPRGPGSDAGSGGGPVRASAWLITGVLVGLACVSAWFFGLDARHAVVVVGAAFAGGIANGLLDGVDLPRPVLAALPAPTRGLADVQALEFSLSSSEPGARAVLELHTLGTALVADVPAASRSEGLDRFLSQQRPPGLSHREVRDLLDELERLSAAKREGGP